MPIYEYEPDDRICYICNGHLEILQSIQDDPLKACPYCGLGICKVVSKVTFHSRKGDLTWERVSGEGVDTIIGTPEDVAAVEAEKAPPPKVIDLDKDPK
jgi:putative FmdB family regulatory protein